VTENGFHVRITAAGITAENDFKVTELLMDTTRHAPEKLRVEASLALLLANKS